MADAYHHGDLRAATVARAVEVIRERGPDGFSLRSLAADLGVSHTAPRHHFGSRRGVLTAVAAQGFVLLGAAIRGVRDSGEGFLEAGVAYVDFAINHPAHFEVMFSPTLLDDADPALNLARADTLAELRTGVDTLAEDGRPADAAAVVLAAWSLVHGLATLALTGNLDRADLRALVGDGDLLDLTRRAASLLGGSTPPS